MPNWCQNQVTLYSQDPALLDAVARAVAGPDQPLSFNAIVPLEEQTNDQGTIHWGTKWDLDSSTDVAREGDTLTYRFDSAWSPPVPVIHAMARKWPALVVHANYLEEGVSVMEAMWFADGRLFSEQHDDPDNFREDCDCELEDGDECEEYHEVMEPSWYTFNEVLARELAPDTRPGAQT